MLTSPLQGGEFKLSTSAPGQLTTVSVELDLDLRPKQPVTLPKTSHASNISNKLTSYQAWSESPADLSVPIALGLE